MSSPATIRQKYDKQDSLIKSDIVAEVQEKLGISERKAIEITHTVLETMTEILAAGKGIQVRGFGTFSISVLKARMGRNPATGAEVPIKSHRVLKFKPSNLMREIIAKIPV